MSKQELEFKNELEIKLAELINPIGQDHDTPKIANEILLFLKSRIKDFDRKIKFKKPTTDEINNYLIEKESAENYSISELKKIGDNFFNYYESCGWLVGKAKKPMVSWKKSLDNWIRRSPKPKQNKMNESVKAYMGIQQLKNQ